MTATFEIEVAKMLQFILVLSPLGVAFTWLIWLNELLFSKRRMFEDQSTTGEIIID